MYSYQHHIRDFNNATMHLTRIEKSVYLDLIHLYYETESPLPLDVEFLARRIRANSSPDERVAVQQVLNEFFTQTASGFFNKVCAENIHEYHNMKTQKSKAGKKSAEKRAAKRKALEDAANGINNNSLDDSEGDLYDDYPDVTGVEHSLTGVETGGQQNPTNQKPETINQKPETILDTHTQPSDFCDSIDENSHEKQKIPHDFLLTNEMAHNAMDYWEGQNVILVVEDVFDRFRNHYLSTGFESCNWWAMWENWYKDNRTLNRDIRNPKQF